MADRGVIKSGVLNKRCRWSWRPRYVELKSNPPDSGILRSYILLIYDQSCTRLKNTLRVEDIVTIRSGKNFGFQIYLNTGMFLFFKADSADNQAAWMADLKMALGKGNMQFHVRVAGGSGNNLGLDHALLYVIGVNLPTHKLDQLDRVLVLASPVNDVNLHAWNTTRIIRFIIIDAGIQMELCPSCMGTHQKKVITFLVRPDFIRDCMDFLLRELQAVNVQPHQYMFNGPYVYNVPHGCGLVERSLSTAVSSSSTLPHYTDSELAVLMPENCSIKTEVSSRFCIKSPAPPPPVTFHASSTISTQTTSTAKPPPLPPRDQPRQFSYVDPQPGGATPPNSAYNDLQPFERPYQISHRIYINDSGGIRNETQVLGSGSGEVRRDTNRPTRAVIESTRVGIDPPQQRPEFVGRAPPVLPPRGLTLDYMRGRSSTMRSMSDSEAAIEFIRRPRNLSDFGGLDEDFPLFPSSSGGRKISPEEAGPSYKNIQRSGSDLSLCTDDISNADFAVMTKVSFKNIIPSSYLPPRADLATKRPMPLPRSKVSKNSTSTEITMNMSIDRPPSVPPRSSKESSFSNNPLYMQRSKSSGSLSSSSSSSGDYQKVKSLSREC